MDRDHVETIVEIVAKSAGVNLIFQKLIGGGDNARVHANRPALADALEFTLLQYAQQLDLELGTHAADLVEEDGAAMSRLETAGLVVDRSSKGAFDVAKQLAFQQAFTERAAIDADIRSVRSRAETVDGPSDEFFSRAGFADQQH